MQQKEIDEISDAFKEAWTDYFGDEISIVALKTSKSEIDDLYGESKKKEYDYENKITVHGTLKESPGMDEMKQAGKKINKTFDVTFVTKEAIDQGLLYINTSSILVYVDRFGKEFRYKIYDEYQKVQFSSNKIFTTIRVIPIA